jgi:hypothetical protein
VHPAGGKCELKGIIKKELSPTRRSSRKKELVKLPSILEIFPQEPL